MVVVMDPTGEDDAAAVAAAAGVRRKNRRRGKGKDPSVPGSGSGDNHAAGDTTRPPVQGRKRSGASGPDLRALPTSLDPFENQDQDQDQDQDQGRVMESEGKAPDQVSGSGSASGSRRRRRRRGAGSRGKGARGSETSDGVGGLEGEDLRRQRSGKQQGGREEDVDDGGDDEEDAIADARAVISAVEWDLWGDSDISTSVAAAGHDFAFGVDDDDDDDDNDDNDDDNNGDCGRGHDHGDRGHGEADVLGDLDRSQSKAVPHKSGGGSGGGGGTSANGTRGSSGSRNSRNSRNSRPGARSQVPAVEEAPSIRIRTIPQGCNPTPRPSSRAGTSGAGAGGVGSRGFTSSHTSYGASHTPKNSAASASASASGSVSGTFAGGAGGAGGSARSPPRAKQDKEAKQGVGIPPPGWPSSSSSSSMDPATEVRWQVLDIDEDGEDAELFYFAKDRETGAIGTVSGVEGQRRFGSKPEPVTLSLIRRLCGLGPTTPRANSAGRVGTADSGGTGTRRTGRGVGEGGAEAAAAAAEEEEERDPTEGLEEVKQLTIAVDTRDDEPVILHPFTFSHTPFPALHSLPALLFLRFPGSFPALPCPSLSCVSLGLALPPLPSSLARNACVHVPNSYLDRRRDRRRGSCQVDAIGEYLPQLQRLQLVDSALPSIRDLGTSLQHLVVLQAPRCGLRDIDGIGALLALEECYLSFNDISDLLGFSLHDRLQVLDLESNCVGETLQVAQLGTCDELWSLTLAGNPVVRSTGSLAEYRAMVCEVCLSSAHSPTPTPSRHTHIHTHTPSHTHIYTLTHTLTH